MRIFLIFALILMIYAAPVYGLRLYEREDLEDSGVKETAEIKREKQKITEDISQAREERERNLHPFVQTVTEGKGSAFDYTAEQNAAIEPGRKTPRIEARSSGFNSGAGIDFMHARPEYRTVQGADEQRPLSILPKEPRPSARLGYICISIILAAFLLAYFFIQPKSK